MDPTSFRGSSGTSSGTCSGTSSGSGSGKVVNCYFAAKIEQVSEDPVIKQSFIRQVLNNAKPDYILKHLDYASFKVAFRTWFQVWSSVILLVVPKTSHWLGPGAYLFQVIGFICASGGNPVISSVYTATVCAFSTCIAWLFAIISLAISHRLRGNPSQQAIIQDLIVEGSCTLDNIEECLVQQIFSGRYLRTDTSVIFAVALVTGIMFLGLSQKLHPTLRLPFIIGVITLCINVCYHAFFPFFDIHMISLSIVKLMLFSLALNVVCSVVIFPETAIHKYFAGYTSLTKRVKTACENNLRFFESMKPSDSGFSNYTLFAKDIMSIRAGVILLEMPASLSRFEVSYGRLGPGGAGEARSCFKNLLNSSSAFDFFYFFVDSRSKLTHRDFKGRSWSVSAASHHHFKIFSTINESYKPVGDYENRQRKDLLRTRLNQESSYISAQDLDYICDLLKPFYSPYLQSNIEALGKIINWLEAANSYRISSIFSRDGHVTKQKQHAKQILEHRDQLVESASKLDDHKMFENYFKDKTEDEDTLLSLISQCSLLTFFVAEQTKMIVDLMDILIEIDTKMPEPRIWTYFSKSIFESSRNFLYSLQFEDPRSEIPVFKKYNNVQFRDPDNSPPSNIFHLVGVKIDMMYKLMLNEDLWFWFRSGCLVTICAVPYFCRTTAQWYFNNRLIWIVIMCGVSTSEYTGETIYVFFAKLVYSFFGCLIGMVAWYISTGNGDGNYYGFAAVSGVLYLYMAYHRHFSHHMSLIPAILYGVSASLVMGTSWVDGKYNMIANIGSGFVVAYTRFISVIIGLCVGFVASIIPTPKSSKVAIRVILSNILGELGNLYCDVASFAFQRLENESVHIVARHDPITQRFRLILVKLAGISKLMTPINHEIPLKGVWPAAKYQALQESITKLVELYQQLHILFDRIRDPEKWMVHILNRAGWYDTDLNADLFSIIHICSGSLRSKTALPKVTHGTLSLKHFDVLKTQWGVDKTTLNERFYRRAEATEMEKGEEQGSKEKGSQVDKTGQRDNLQSDDLHESMKKNLDYEKLLSHDGNLNIVALVLCHIIYQQLDQVTLIIKSLVGEKYDLNDELLRERDGDYKIE